MKQQDAVAVLTAAAGSVPGGRSRRYRGTASCVDPSLLGYSLRFTFRQWRPATVVWSGFHQTAANSTRGRICRGCLRLSGPTVPTYPTSPTAAVVCPPRVGVDIQRLFERSASVNQGELASLDSCETTLAGRALLQSLETVQRRLHHHTLSNGLASNVRRWNLRAFARGACYPQSSSSVRCNTGAPNRSASTSNPTRSPGSVAAATNRETMNSGVDRPSVWNRGW